MPTEGPAKDGPEFEEVVAALLKVDPEGISAKATKKKAAKNDDDGSSPDERQNSTT